MDLQASPQHTLVSPQTDSIPTPQFPFIFLSLDTAWEGPPIVVLQWQGEAMGTLHAGWIPLGLETLPEYRQPHHHHTHDCDCCVESKNSGRQHPEFKLQLLCS